MPSWPPCRSGDPDSGCTCVRRHQSNMWLHPGALCPRSSNVKGINSGTQPSCLTSIPCRTTGTQDEKSCVGCLALPPELGCERSQEAKEDMDAHVHEWLKLLRHAKYTAGEERFLVFGHVSCTKAHSLLSMHPSRGCSTP